jgi:hypothetical protein
MMDWRTPNGCASCRPAINYYLLSTWPKEAKDDPQSRYINERSHANIQKDGTYSVIPRMWGGETTADELRRIADAVDKYKIPDREGHRRPAHRPAGREEGRPADVWKDIGMPSGHAYAKALRTVKTCVGSEWCRFGTQDSTQMGKDLERALWRMYAPHKVKLAVSGCPRNCAEAGIKDVGRDRRRLGWEIYIAGNGGIKTEVAHFFCKLKTSAEVLNTAAPSCSCTARKAGTLRAHRALRQSRGPGLREEEDPGRHEGRRALWERLQFSLDGETRSPVRIRQGIGGYTAIRQAGGGARSMKMNDWTEVCRVDDIPVLGSRRVARAQWGRTSPSSAMTRNQVFALARTAAPTRGARCRRASCSAPASPARCTTGPLAWPTDAPRRPTRAAPPSSRARSRPAGLLTGDWPPATTGTCRPDPGRSTARSGDTLRVQAPHTCHDETRSTCPYCGVGCG